jgi:hypothetical protein
MSGLPLAVIVWVSLLSFLVLLDLNLLLVVLTHYTHLGLTSMSRDALFLAANRLL